MMDGTGPDECRLLFQALTRRDNCRVVPLEVLIFDQRLRRV